MLEIERLTAGYGAVTVLREVLLTARPGEVHCLLGRNGAGKTTLMKAIMGLVPASAGTVRLDGQDLTRLPTHEVPRHGIGYVPQGRRLFAGMTVAENLEIGLMTRGRGRDVRERMIGLFPVLGDRLSQRAGTLSGGEQQQLAMARALCLEPKVLLLDEPTEGLQPSMIALIRDTVVRLAAEGVATILVEQRVDAVLEIAHRVSFLASGRIAQTLDVVEARERPDLVHHYVGVS